MADREGGRPNVLIAYATRHGATREIAEKLKSVLAGRGLQADTFAVGDVGALSGYTAVVLGSAVYMGRWLKAARDFADSLRGELAGKPVWLFSSGPTGERPKPKDVPFGVDELKAALAARDHRVFGGKIDRDVLSFTERAVLKMVSAASGDFRDWTDVANWANAIADALKGRAAAA